jgi:hypothetical protein
VIDDSLLDNMRAQGSNTPMSSKPDLRKASRRPLPTEHKPVWADSLKRMYDSVVGEDVPDDIANLLRKLDQASDPE